ncbi:hypothetical protein JI435_110350, partial [Parastagonospora nodorum SN15]
ALYTLNNQKPSCPRSRRNEYRQIRLLRLGHPNRRRRRRLLLRETQHQRRPRCQSRSRPPKAHPRMAARAATPELLPSDASTTSQLLAAAPAQRSQAGAGSGIAGSPGFGGGADESGNPSVQANMDPAPTRHEPADAEARAREKSKYEAGDVYRSRKGDRFS